ncbi:MAG: hypothetical protein H7Z41_04605 [Cytophagales bacterium]|nr:hypothetical protein [Armatimonadota bacterium]
MRPFFVCFLIVLSALISALPAPAAPPAEPAAKAAPAQIRLDLKLTRTDAEGDALNAGTAPVVIAAPTLSTLDRGTATSTLTSADLGYSLSISPSVEKLEASGAATVQALWNVRLSGRTLPGGVNSVSESGATRFVSETGGGGSDTLLSEMLVRDLKTGRTARFRLTGRVTILPAAVPGSASVQKTANKTLSPGVW